MNLNKWTRSLTVVALVGATAACDNDLTEINENPNNPEVVPVEAVLSSGIWDMIGSGVGTHGQWTTLYHVSSWAQHSAQSAYNDEDNYGVRAGINESIWSSMYSGALTDLQRAQQLAQEQGDANLVAVTDILLVYGFLFLTDLFGDVPYFEALNLEEFPQPAFTPQAEIYPDLLKRLEAAAGQIAPARRVDWASGDLIYGGDLERWAEFANSLRLRIAMRTSFTPFAPTASTEFQEAWNANRFDSNADNATLTFTGTLPSLHPYHEQIVLGGRTGDFRVSATIEEQLSSTDDPRLEVFLEPAASDGAFRGLPNGALPADLGLTVADFSTIGSAFIAANAPAVLMSHAEVLFLGAEAAARGWISGNANALCEQGIEASMAQYGISASEIAAYLAANPCVGLEDILTQKWIALYFAGPEAYAEVRRTNVPDLPLPFDAIIDQLPARMPYPANEALYNENFAAYAEVPYTTPLWWMP